MLRSLNIARSILKSNVIRLAPAKNAYHVLYTPRHSTINSLVLSKSLHVQTTSYNRYDSESIDRSLLRLDGEIRKTGRINRREIEEILEDIREMKKATSSQSLMIIRCCGDLLPEETPENRAKLIQEVWKTMESLNVPIDISHYNALLKVYLENEYKFSPTEFLQELSNKGIEPNRVTYQRLVARFCQDGDIDGASTILQHMKDKQLPINEHVFNALIHGHAQANDMESAEGIIAVMKQAGLEPSDDTYTTLALGFAKMGDINNVHRIVKECNDLEIFLLDRDFLNIIYTLAANNHDNLIDEIVPCLKKHTGFNQEAANVILRLVNIGKTEIAYKILQLMPRAMRQDEYVPSGNFFVNQLVRSNVPSEEVVKYCLRLEESGLNKYALVRATEHSLLIRNFDKAFDLLEALKESGFPIRQHYFWPFFAGNPTEKEVYDGLKCMMYMEIYPQQETLREYIVPAILKATYKKNESFEATLEKLSAYSRIPMSQIFPCAVQYLLGKDDLKTAAKFSLRYKANFSTPYLRRSLVEAYLRNHDGKSVARLLGSTGSTNEDEAVRETVGHFLVELMDASGHNKATVLAPLLPELLAAGLGISNSTAELLQNSLGEKLTPDLTNKISNLTAGDLKRKIEPYNETKREENYDERTVAQLEELLERSKKLGRPNKGLQKTLIFQYCTDNNIEKAHQLVTEMRNDGFVFGPRLESKLLNLYCDNNKLEEAKEIFNSMQEKHLDMKFEDILLLKYTLLHATNGLHEEVLNIIKTQPRDDMRQARGFIQNSLVWKILNVYADAGKVEDTKVVLQALEERGLTAINNMILGPLIKAHLVNDDLSGALAEFETCVAKYQATPYKQELYCRFIKAEDADRLQKVLDLSSNIYGEVNCLYDLVFAFLECGKIRQAKKILDTPGLRARNEKLEYTCQKYLENNRVEDLEKLVEITKDIFDVDRNSLYFYLLKAYCKIGDADKALSIWTSLQEENIQPSPELLSYLAAFLQKNNKPIPFVIPKPSTVPSTGSPKNSTASPKTSSVSIPKAETTKGSTESLYQKFKRALDSNNLDQALRLRQQIEPLDGAENRERTIKLSDYNSLVLLMLQTQRKTDALQLIEEMSSRGSYPHIPTLKQLASVLSTDGDVDSLRSLEKWLTSGVKATIRLDNHIVSGYINANRGVEYFEMFIKKRIEEFLQNQGEEPKIPILGLTKILIKNEDLLPEYEKLSSTVDEKHAHLLNNAVWCYYFMKKDFSKANEIWNTKNLNNENTTVNPALSLIRINNDIELAQQAMNHVNSDISSGREKGYAVSVLAEVLVHHGEAEKALEIIQNTLVQTPQEEIHRKTQIKLKKALAEKNINYPFEIPPKRQRRRNNRNNDSDDE